MGRENDIVRHSFSEFEKSWGILKEATRSGSMKCVIDNEECVVDVIERYGWTKWGFAKRIRFKGNDFNIVRKEDIWVSLKESAPLTPLPVKEQCRQVPEEVLIFPLNWVGENVPMFYYDSERFGQVTWLSRRCKEEGIKTHMESDYILLYAKSKAERFKELVKESFKYDDIRPAPIKGKSATFHIGHALACVLVGEESFVTEPHVPDLVEFIFKKQIPHTKVFRIFPTKVEMVEALLKEHRIIV